MLFKVQKKLICFDKKLVRRNTLMKISSNVWGNFEEILREFWELPGKYRMLDVESVGSKGLSQWQIEYLCLEGDQ